MTETNSVSPLVSVILPTFNRAATLPRAVRSVLQQSYRNLELIVVDDGSTDDTGRVLRTCADDRSRLIHRARGGPGAARNTGIATARGDLIAFQDSDDEWLPQKLARQVAALRNAGANFGVNICCYREHSPGKAADFLPDEFMARGEALGSLLSGRNFITPTWLVRKSALDRAGVFDEGLPSCEDYDLLFRLQNSARFQFIPDVLVLKYDSAESVYNHAGARAEGRRQVLERYRPLWHSHRTLLAGQERTVGGFLLGEGRLGIGLRYLAAALARDPVGQSRFATTWLWRKLINEGATSRATH